MSDGKTLDKIECTQEDMEAVFALLCPSCHALWCEWDWPDDVAPNDPEPRPCPYCEAIRSWPDRITRMSREEIRARQTQITVIPAHREEGA